MKRLLSRLTLTTTGLTDHYQPLNIANVLIHLQVFTSRCNLKLWGVMDKVHIVYSDCITCLNSEILFLNLSLGCVTDHTYIVWK